ncbi:autoinducer 2 sensor kinase/phosphatase LuxQ [Janthinobacterium sp. HH103]|uniref:hybrid sensor histidine kinase/response regulator n=3 Tax=Oxalobacteraceae TaxID=75682 RepID=UPI00089406A3|nr:MULTISPECIES: hybrid sensor histidine kinase/response regulator [Janthinobacterium]OEZ72347.1 autoinducer 2 sensor kinase/phosphatase LuxQ [Janthinobacterium sp. HH103]QOU74515.1 Sensor histidine kinase RcsC [Janthinobacterium sp. HH102]
MPAHSPPPCHRASSSRVSAWLCGWPLVLSLLFGLLGLAGAAQATPLPLSKQGLAHLGKGGQLFLAENEAAPADVAALPAWLARQRPADQVDLFGGAYWLHAQVRNDSSEAAWVIDPNDTLIDLVDVYVYGPGPHAAPRTLLTGYQRPHDYLLHYGMNVQLAPGATYDILIRFSSPYYARAPLFGVKTQHDYRKLVGKENFLMVASIGALLALGLFNFFIFSITLEKASAYYALYVLTYGLAWAMTFHVFADLFDWHQLQLHYVPFFLLPVFSTLFYMHFLRLRDYSLLLYRLSKVNLALPLLLLPSCFFALSYAHTLATIAISIWMLLALICGIVVWRRGYQPARFFVLAFVALMLPGFLILPANLGLMPAMVANAQLVTLLGGTFDGLLLAFALADQIRLLRNNLEQRVQERTLALTLSNDALLKAKEHAEVVSRHRIDFLSAMSHDIRTPLAGVIGMLKFALRDQSVKGRTQEYLRIGLHNGVSLLTILNDILDFSKIDAGKLTLETVDFDLLALIGDAAGIVQGQADAKSLLLRRELALDLPRYVRADPTRLRQILINLLGNALKFTANGEVLLEVRRARTPPRGDGRSDIEFIISDTGPGIDADTLPRLFQKFEQADHSTTRRYGGTGLGLAICKELVELMQGTIGVESRVGIGSRFHFTLPLTPGSAPAADARRPARQARHACRLRILCAEDVRTNQIIIGTLLESMGHDVTIVENGEQALRALGSGPYDCVLMDGRMPEMDGEQAARLIRDGGNAQFPIPDAHIPILALTANASEHDRQRYLAAGMDDFLSKPVDEALLFEKIDAIIDLLLARGHALPQAAPIDDDTLARQFGLADAEDAQAQTPAPPDPMTAPVHILPLAGLSAQHLQRIAQAFLTEAPRRLDLACHAVRDGNASAAAAAFHALKGSAGYLSRPTLHGLCHQMETLASNGQLDNVEQFLPQLQTALDVARRDLENQPGA